MPEEFEEVEELKIKKLKNTMALTETSATFFRIVWLGAKLSRWIILKNRGWGCSWISCKLKAG